MPLLSKFHVPPAGADPNRRGWKHARITGRSRNRRRLALWAAAAMALPAVLTAAGAQASAGVVHVAPAGASKPQAPYDTWARAANDLSVAMEYAEAHYPACHTVLVSNGTYRVAKEIRIAKPIRVFGFGAGRRGGMANARRTILDGGGATRVLNINGGTPAASVCLDGLTIQNGNHSGGNSDGGGGVRLAGAYNVFSNCVFRSNTQTGRGGAGVYGDGAGAEFHNCEFSGNSHGGEGDAGGGATYSDGGDFSFYNCLIAGNRSDSEGGGCFNRGGGNLVFENCTIVSNRTAAAAGYGGGVRKRDSGSVTLKNTIARFNTAGGGVEDNVRNSVGGAYSYSCTTSPALPGAGMISGDPLFSTVPGETYRLADDSPCIDAGQTMPWMAAAVDLGGKSRLFGKAVDMGVYEYRPHAPVLGASGPARADGKTAAVSCDVLSVGAEEAALFVCHGPADGGTNRAAWAQQTRRPGTLGEKGMYETVISPAGEDSMWFYRCLAVNRYGESWTDPAGTLLTGEVEVRATARSSTEERLAAFVLSRPAAATNAPLSVYISFAGGVNGRDFDWIESPTVIPAGSAEVRLPLIPSFPFGDNRSKIVTLKIEPGAYRIGQKNSAAIVTVAR